MKLEKMSSFSWMTERKMGKDKERECKCKKNKKQNITIVYELLLTEI